MYPDIVIDDHGAPSAQESHPATEPDDADCPKSVLGKTQLLLSAFGGGSSRLRLTELSRRSGVPKASVYRLAQELVSWGFLDRVEDGYQLGVRVFELGERAPVSGDLRALARPALADLFAATRATVHLAVLEGSHVLYLDKVAGAANVHSHSRVGGRLPASCTSTGKLLLALDPDVDARLQDMARSRLPRPTSRSVATLPQLRRQLTDAAEHGHAVEIGELTSGIGGVAVPVRAADGSAVAAVSAAMPLDRFSTTRLLPPLRTAAAAISRAVAQRGLAGLAGSPRVGVVAS